MANINKQFPQGANPVEKAMSLQQMSAQKNDLARRIEDLSSQIASLRPQAI
jgi:prefoldin subunit 5